MNANFILKNVGDIVANSKAVKIATSLTPHVMKLLHAAEEIRLSRTIR